MDLYGKTQKLLKLCKKFKKFKKLIIYSFLSNSNSRII
jgi:hypothetical protein